MQYGRMERVCFVQVGNRKEYMNLVTETVGESFISLSLWVSMWFVRLGFVTAVPPLNHHHAVGLVKVPCGSVNEVGKRLFDNTP